jgi:hypothetical protein
MSAPPRTRIVVRPLRDGGEAHHGDGNTPGSQSGLHLIATLSVDGLIRASFPQYRLCDTDPDTACWVDDPQRERHDVGSDNLRLRCLVLLSRLAVGTDRRRLFDALADPDTTPFLDVAVTAGAAGITVSVAAREGAAGDVWLVRFDRCHVTEVPAGENNGKTLVNHHVVTALSRIGEFRGASVTVETPLAFGADEHCAVLVQRPAGPILGAAYCP